MELKIITIEGSKKLLDSNSKIKITVPNSLPPESFCLKTEQQDYFFKQIPEFNENHRTSNYIFKLCKDIAVDKFPIKDYEVQLLYKIPENSDDLLRIKNTSNSSYTVI